MEQQYTKQECNEKDTPSSQITKVRSFPESCFIDNCNFNSKNEQKPWWHRIWDHQCQWIKRRH